MVLRQPKERWKDRSFLKQCFGRKKKNKKKNETLKQGNKRCDFKELSTASTLSIHPAKASAEGQKAKQEGSLLQGCTREGQQKTEWIHHCGMKEVLQYFFNCAVVKKQEVRWAMSNNWPLESPWVTVRVSFANFDVAVECVFPFLTQQLNSLIPQIPQWFSGWLVITNRVR